jgi:hypothetical protein
MADFTDQQTLPSGWADALADSEADLAAGRIVSGDAVMRELGEALARPEAAAPAERDGT